LGSEYVPSQAKLVEPSGFPVAFQVPLSFIPLNFPVPLVACHLLVPDCILLSAMAPVQRVAMPRSHTIDSTRGKVPRT